MASEGPKSAALLLLFINLVLYFIVMIIAAWAVNHGIERSHESASVLSLPATIFPIYFPVGNMATGFFIIFSLLVGLLGTMTSLTGMYSLMQWTAAPLYAAASSSLATWALTLLAMGLASKEIHKGYTDSNLRTMEVIMIVLSGTQLICTGTIHATADGVAGTARRRMLGGRV